jgi:hypothetical protein
MNCIFYVIAAKKSKGENDRISEVDVVEIALKNQKNVSNLLSCVKQASQYLQRKECVTMNSKGRSSNGSCTGIIPPHELCDALLAWASQCIDPDLAFNLTEVYFWPK